jgi:molybdopterin synthase catalytic subunit
VKQEILITTEAIDGSALAAARASGPGMGAVVHFLGVVRGSEEGASIEAIDYTAFVPMAEVQFRKLLDEAARRWPLESVRVVHRLGVVRVGEPSLWMEVVSPHRAEAFDACRWIIDEMKRVVPIWKRAVPVVA